MKFNIVEVLSNNSSSVVKSTKFVSPNCSFKGYK